MELPVLSGVVPDHSQAAKDLIEQHLRSGGTDQQGQEHLEESKQRVRDLLKRENAVLVAHYYTDGVIQELAKETGGCVSDSLEMAKFGAKHDAKTLVVAGVRFMGETAKILTPEKRVVMPTLEANCSLDIGCPPDEFSAFCDEHPDRTVVVYANTSAAVKARADWVVTSSIALEIIQHLKDKGEKILWAPDKHLGGYLQKQIGADMLLWDASCVVHDEFKAFGLSRLKAEHPDAAVLVHPESPAEVVELADIVGSTSHIRRAASELPNQKFIVATDQGIFHSLQQDNPDKEFFIAPTMGKGADCRACSFCPWMAMNELDGVIAALEAGKDSPHEIHVDPVVGQQALVALNRMMRFAEEHQVQVKGMA